VADTQPEVPSPLHAALSELYANIQRDEPTMANALKNACQQMGGGIVWYGSAASGWAGQLNGHSGDLSSSISAAVTEVYSALAAVSPTCSVAEARTQELILSGRLS
jgi:hypothetical protein